MTGSYIGKYKAEFVLNDYAPSQLTPSGIISNSSILINSSSSFRIKGSANYYIYQFTEPVNFSVSPVDSSISNYSSTITITVPNSNSVKIEITRDGEKRTLIDTSDSSIRKQWLPMQFDDSKYELHNKDYGWWED